MWFDLISSIPQGRFFFHKVKIIKVFTSQALLRTELSNSYIYLSRISHCVYLNMLLSFMFSRVNSIENKRVGTGVALKEHMILTLL